MEQSIQLSEGDGEWSDRYFLAMIEAKLGNAKQAAVMLEQADQWLEANPASGRYLPVIQQEARQVVLGEGE